ncbi:RNase adapter RapZ [Gordonia sp. CPCC 205333]|uniref:RNase adapter RapZ n=1 Tax=Gordonia sp. CPCC 205333 TaxID=3140790 RepID=UPI003AF3FCEE
MTEEMSVVFIAGMSGAGMTTAADIFEDAGWYVADNVPVGLIGTMVDLARAGQPKTSRLAMVVRGTDAQVSDDLVDLRARLDSSGAQTSMIFLDASDDVLVRRFEQVRRRHPLQAEETLVDGIDRERDFLAGVKLRADLVVDTSTLPVAKFRGIIEDTYPSIGRTGLSVAIKSFGFKYGLPIDSDLVADVRFLPNPYWIPELRADNGLDAPVRDYVLGQDGASRFIDLYVDLISLVVDGYLREGKRYMAVSVGCTGGKHRSVAMATELGNRLAQAGIDDVDVQVSHRDLGRE